MQGVLQADCLCTLIVQELAAREVDVAVDCHCNTVIEESMVMRVKVSVDYHCSAERPESTVRSATASIDYQSNITSPEQTGEWVELPIYYPNKINLVAMKVKLTVILPSGYSSKKVQQVLQAAALPILPVDCFHNLMKTYWMAKWAIRSTR